VSQSVPQHQAAAPKPHHHGESKPKGPASGQGTTAPTQSSGKIDIKA